MEVWKSYRPLVLITENERSQSASTWGCQSRHPLRETLWIGRESCLFIYLCLFCLSSISLFCISLFRSFVRNLSNSIHDHQCYRTFSVCLHAFQEAPAGQPCSELAVLPVPNCNFQRTTWILTIVLLDEMLILRTLCFFTWMLCSLF